MFQGTSLGRFSRAAVWALLVAAAAVLAVAAGGAAAHGQAAPSAPGPGPEAGPEAGPGESQVIALSQELVEAMMAGRFEDVTDRFGPAIAGALSPQELGAIWSSLPLQVGPLAAVGEPWLAAAEPLRLVRVPLYFEAAQLDLVFGFDDDLLLGTLVFVPHEPRPQAAPERAPEPAPALPSGADVSATSDAAPAAPAGEGESAGEPGAAPDDREPGAAVAEAAPEPEMAGGAPPRQAPDGPPYADPSRFEEYELTFGLPEFPLGGTLTLPKGEGPFPAVVLVHGSGPHDRDETALMNKPFRDLAWGLASRGIAVFRYDKRTYVHAQAMAADPDMTVDDETIVDAVEAVRMLRARDDISRVYVAGHSQGGMLAPYMALEEPGIDGLILLAANARSIGELTLAQIDYLLSGYAAPGTEAALEAMRPEVERLVAGDLEGIDVLLGIPAGYWADFQNRDQTGVAAALPQPMLILQGARDYQVTVTDFELWQEALAHKDNAAYRLYPGLNHLFMPGEGPGTPLEYARPGFVAEEVIEDMAAWIHAQQ